MQKSTHCIISPVCLRRPLPARESPPSAKRQHTVHQGSQRQRPELLHPVNNAQRPTVAHRLHHLRANHGRRRTGFHHGQQAKQEVVHGETVLAGIKFHFLVTFSGFKASYSYQISYHEKDNYTSVLIADKCMRAHGTA